MNDLIFLDTETTGLDFYKGDRIVELCCLKINKISYKKIYFHHYLKSKTPVSDSAYNIHGISDEFLKNKPYFKDIVYSFINFIYNNVILIHNARFDLGFLNYHLNELKLSNLNNYCYKIIDTLSLSKKIYPNNRNSLKFLCKKFNISLSKRKKHSAIEDVRLLYEVYINLFKIKNKLNFKFINKNNYYNNKINFIKKINNIKILNINKTDKILNNFIKKKYLI